MIHYCAKCSATLAHGEGSTVDRVLPLTVKQRRLYDFLVDRIHVFGYAPSFEEIASEFGYSSLATIHEHLTNLERKGWIVRDYNRSRSLQCVGPDCYASAVALPTTREER